MTLDLRIFTEPQQGATYDDLLAVAQATEELGSTRSSAPTTTSTMGDRRRPARPHRRLDRRSRASPARRRPYRLGTLVSSATFRHPGVLAIQVAQVDQMSGGRVELGLGAGWFARGAQRVRHPVPRRSGSASSRSSSRSSPACGARRSGETFSFSGEHYEIDDSPALPKPAQPRIPVLVGGGGPRRTPALAAKYGDEYNQSFPEISEVGSRIRVIEKALSDAGRAPESIVQSVALVAAVGQDEAEFTRRAAAIGREPAELREHGIAGTVTEVVDRLKALEAEGVQRVYLQVLDLADLDHLDVIAREVRPQLG